MASAGAEKTELGELIDFALEHQLVEKVSIEGEWVAITLEGEVVRMQSAQARAFLAAIVRAFEHSPSISWHSRKY